MFVCPTFSVLRFYGCCQYCFTIVSSCKMKLYANVEICTERGNNGLFINQSPKFFNNVSLLVGLTIDIKLSAIVLSLWKIRGRECTPLLTGDTTCHHYTVGGTQLAHKQTSKIYRRVWGWGDGWGNYVNNNLLTYLLKRTVNQIFNHQIFWCTTYLIHLKQIFFNVKI